MVKWERAGIQAILNIIDKEYRMNLWIQIINDIIVTSLNGILVMGTQSVWVALLPRGLYALTGLYRSKKLVIEKEVSSHGNWK